MDLNIQCCFVNTDQQPTKIKQLKVFYYFYRDNKIVFEELCEVFYPHPDSPENALVSVYRWYEVKVPEGTEQLIKNAIDGVTGISKISKLM